MGHPVRVRTICMPYPGVLLRRTPRLLSGDAFSVLPLCFLCGTQFVYLTNPLVYLYL